MTEVCAMTGVVPHLTIRDNRASEAIDFYTRAFGAVERRRHPAEDGKRLMHAHLEINGGPLMLNDDFPEMMGDEASPPPAGVGLHLEVPNADRAWERALGAGASVRFPSTTSSGDSDTGRSPIRSGMSGRSAVRSRISDDGRLRRAPR